MTTPINTSKTKASDQNGPSLWNSVIAFAKRWSNWTSTPSSSVSDVAKNNISKEASTADIRDNDYSLKSDSPRSTTSITTTDETPVSQETTTDEPDGLFEELRSIKKEKEEYQELREQHFAEKDAENASTTKNASADNGATNTVNEKNTLETTSPLAPSKDSLDSMQNATLEDLIEWRKKGILDHNLPSIRVITREKDTPIDEKDLEAILSLCPNLEILNMGNGSNLGANGDKIFSVIGKCCPNLKSFSIHSFGQNVYNYPGDHILIALAQCSKLKKVQISCSCFDPPFSKDAMIHFLRGCQGVEDLELEGMTLDENLLFLIGEAKLPLKRISFHSCLPNREVTAKLIPAYIALFKGNPLLKEVILPESTNLTDAALEALADNCPHVTKLVVTGSRQVTAKGLQAVLNKCTKLVDLYE